MDGIFGDDWWMGSLDKQEVVAPRVGKLIAMDT